MFEEELSRDATVTWPPGGRTLQEGARPTPLPGGKLPVHPIGTPRWRPMADSRNGGLKLRQPVWKKTWADVFFRVACGSTTTGQRTSSGSRPTYPHGSSRSRHRRRRSSRSITQTPLENKPAVDSNRRRVLSLGSKGRAADQSLAVRHRHS
jgi:hypothetical protein